ncbi:hypothetical protein PACTADRAFT_51683 [Pachysolen tannophilus NRRL Y-2460]|uniref:Uncharacterized protein n=1 Tax=Pachysolen tannophilus NRRL Y-2460 TaxID=669874 RepID=A0A1E4TQB6_PACTA|nr:hypothetical protein PACTADRAFT_51683 [Pachysolen tannophilus NRRL Y-2460]
MFTPVETSIGALLIQFATTSYMLQVGRAVGFSSILYNSITKPNVYDLSIAIGLLSSAYIVKLIFPEFIPLYNQYINIKWYIVSGLLVGIGTQFGCGCTSGHVIAGLSRLRKRSIIATIFLFATAMLVVNYFKLGENCYNLGKLDYCIKYDKFFIKFYKNRKILVELLMSSFLLTYFILPFITKKLNKFGNGGLINKFLIIINGLYSGCLFGLGLAISGMSSPSKTIGFLAIFQQKKFDPSLSLIILFTVIPNYFVWKFKIFNKNNKPILNQSFSLNKSNQIPKKFILGNILFGLGWGIMGICPGPGLMGVIFNGNNGLAWFINFILGYFFAKCICI